MFHLRDAYSPQIVSAARPRRTVRAAVRIGYEYGEEIDGQKYIGRHGDQNGVEWALWDSCPSAASLLDCETDTRFRGTQSAYADEHLEWVEEPIPVGKSAPSREELVEKIIAFASTPHELKAGAPGGETSPGGVTHLPSPPPPSSKKVATKTAPSKSTPTSAPTASIAQADNTTIVFILLGAIGAGLIVMKLLA